MIRDNLIEVLHEMEEVTKLFKLEPFVPLGTQE